MDSKEVISSKKLSNSYRFIKALQTSDKLLIDGTRVRGDNFSQLEVLFKAVETFYHGVWDIHFDISSELPIREQDTEQEIINNLTYFNIKGVYLFFKYVTISNSQGKTHDIEDLYVRLVLTHHSEKINIIDIQGTRGVLTTLEYRSNYGHSHLRDVSGHIRSKSFSSFCLGSGEINMYISRVNSSRDSFKENIQSLLLQIMTLVSWESLEGVPYHRIGYMLSNSSEVTEQTFKNRMESPIFKKNLRESLMPAFINRINRYMVKPKIVYGPKGISIVRDEDYYKIFEDFEEDELRELNSYFPSNILTKRLGNKIFGYNNTSSESLAELTDSEKDFNNQTQYTKFLLFQGKYIRPQVKIIPSMDKEAATMPYKIDKFFVDYVTTLIERKLDKIFTESYFKEKLKQQVK